MGVILGDPGEGGEVLVPQRHEDSGLGGVKVRVAQDLDDISLARNLAFSFRGDDGRLGGAYILDFPEGFDFLPDGKHQIFLIWVLVRSISLTMKWFPEILSTALKTVP